ncbi:hypothetical protein OL67_003337 [Phaeobacter piscinae]|nr:hypothetical protein OL67_003337 [Phaeobacter piscinae]
MSTNRNSRHWPLIEHISPRAAKLLNEDLEPLEFNAGWLVGEDSQYSSLDSTYPEKRTEQG